MNAIAANQFLRGIESSLIGSNLLLAMKTHIYRIIKHLERFVGPIKKVSRPNVFYALASSRLKYSVPPKGIFCFTWFLPFKVSVEWIVKVP